MTDLELAVQIVKEVTNYLDNTDCSCGYDEFTTCWYHLSYEEQQERIARHILPELEEFRNKNSA